MRSRPSAEDRIRRATEAWFITEPLLFSAWITHRLAARPGAGTLRVGEGRVEYDPAFIQALPDRTLAELLRLEAVRIVLKHPYSRRPDRGDIAYLASNITLKEHVPTRLPLPSAADVFGDPSLSRQYYELYCDRLLEPGAPRAAAKPQRDVAEPAEGAGQGRAEAEPGAASDAVADHFDAIRGPERAQLWQDDCLAREQIDEVIREAERSDSWGSLPGSLVTQILATLRPRLDYRSVLRGFRTSILSSRRELTRMKPSRRYGFDCMGSRYRLRTRLLVAVDVSGSIGDDDLERAFSVVNRLFQYGVEAVDVVQFDAAITSPITTVKKRRLRVSVQGRGGTDFDPVLALLDERRDYDGLVIITDGIAPRPEPPKNKRTRVLWLFHNERTYLAMRSNVAHIGRAAYIRPDPAPGTARSPGRRRP